MALMIESMKYHVDEIPDLVLIQILPSSLQEALKTMMEGGLIIASMKLLIMENLKYQDKVSFWAFLYYSVALFFAVFVFV